MPTDSANTPPPVDSYEEPQDHTKTLMNAAAGGGAGIVFSFIPGSPLLGGAIAGYLEGGETTDGLWVGLFAGLIMLIPVTFFGMVAFTFFAGGPGVLGTFLLVMFLIGMLYALGLSIFGAVIGVYLKNEL
ncbi:DUF5518 domain-containing protein [Natronolimnobius baerhuensis]|uniref:DUF5518 domain-containing protein n=1 Tax=Natronolimnobius baerhuensis TaxID=253108 RepID=A0A202EBX0_9EURY|nr:DUF5518 domain-containing protein [Natronolimnobius baerhuensis]OVE85721.1 hypothetical protein B2G88_02575 [Natronolimnobius baerhuensis]